MSYLDGGSPFYKTISSLTKGQEYYVRVSAGNSQGYGTPQSTAPSESGAPSDVELGITSESDSNVEWFADSNAGCSVATVIDGTTIEGFFVLEGSDALPHDVSAQALASALSETAAAQVTVSREGPDAQNGFVSWAS